VRASDLRSFREGRGWSRTQLAELLNEALGRSYKDDSIGRWERGQRELPDDVSALLDSVALDAALGSALPEGDRPEDGEAAPAAPPGDSPPPPPGGAGPPAGGGGQIVLPTSANPQLTRLCEELWEMVATGVGMVGAVTGSEALRRDGEIIHADKEQLGKAYARLAETNETFRRMITGMTTSGAWLEVAMASGITAGKMMRSHQEIREQKRQAAAQAAAEEPEVVLDYGDGFPASAAA